MDIPVRELIPKCAKHSGFGMIVIWPDGRCQKSKGFMTQHSWLFLFSFQTYISRLNEQSVVGWAIPRWRLIFQWQVKVDIPWHGFYGIYIYILICVITIIFIYHFDYHHELTRILCSFIVRCIIVHFLTRIHPNGSGILFSPCLECFNSSILLLTNQTGEPQYLLMIQKSGEKTNVGWC